MLNNLLYTSGRILLLVFAGVMLKMNIHRHGILPAGSKIFVSNHPSATDPFMIHIISREQTERADHRQGFHRARISAGSCAKCGKSRCL